jgi:hypothetical protein
LHDNAQPHEENFMKVTLAIMGLEIMNHLPYSCDFASINEGSARKVEIYTVDECRPELAMQSGYNLLCCWHQ